MVPTPLQPADRLGSVLGLAPGRLFVKRDDLTPLAGGGNKVRKLEHLCAAAVAAGSDVLVTGGGAQSNHVRATAVAARAYGLDAVAVLSGSAPERFSGNLVVDALTGTRLVWTGLSTFVELESAIDAEAGRLAADGRRPYTIPIGGADAVGSQGYVLAAAELREQLPGADLVVVAAGSGGTQAGLAVGFGDHRSVLGVGVGAFTDIAERVDRLAIATARLAGRPEPAGPVRMDTRYVAAGYGTELDEARAALRLAAQTEGLLLDPVYTAKALAGLRAGLAEGSIDRDQRVVFLHTGGAFGLLSERYANWATEGSRPL